MRREKGMPGRLLLCVMLALVLAPVMTPVWAGDQGLQAWDRIVPTRFNRLTAADGMANGMATSVAQDSTGVMWFGTINGLVRYDGYRLQNFFNIKGDPASLPNNYVRALSPMAGGGLLIGGNDGQLARFDPATDSFQTLHLDGVPGFGEKIYAFAAAADGGVWVAYRRGLLYLDADKGVLRHEALTDADGKTLFDAAFSVLEDSAGDLWVGGDSGLAVRRHGERVFTAVHDSTPLGQALTRDAVWSLREGAQGRLWFGTVRMGGAWIERGSLAFHPVKGVSGADSLIRGRTVRDIAELSPDGPVWMATDGVGIIAADLDGASARQVSVDPSQPMSLSGDLVRALYRDRSGNLWAATQLGMSWTDLNPHAARALFASNKLAQGLADPNVAAVATDRHKRVWLGLGLGMIDVIDLDKSTIRHLRLPGRQAEREVQCLMVDQDGALLACSRGVTRIDPDSLAMTELAIPGFDQITLSVARLGEDLLLGTYSGLFRFSPRTGQLAHFQHDPKDPASLVNDEVREIEPMPDGSIWIGTIAGISVMKPGQPGFRNYRPVPNDPSGQLRNNVLSIKRDRLDRNWIGTQDAVGVADLQGGGGDLIFRLSDVGDWHPHVVPAALLQDAKDRVWVSSTDGIDIVDYADGTLTRSRPLGIRDGVYRRTHLPWSSAIGPNGELLFGALDGLTIIFPDQLQDAPPPAPLAVTGMLVNHQRRPSGTLPNPTRGLALAADQRSLTLEFALLDYTAPSETHYSYRLDGFDKDWVELSHPGQAEASYTNLPHGRYRLSLRAWSKGDPQPVAELSFPLTVAPFWYESALARIGGFLALLVAMWGIVRLRTGRHRRQEHALAGIVAQRTRELTEANRRLTEQAHTDPLTRLLNRRRFIELAEAERERARRLGHPFSVVLFDLDHFKAVNDTFGHHAGDQVLQAACAVIRDCMRSIDVVARYGGEELIALLPGTSADPALQLAERVGATLATQPIVGDGHEVRITTSAGVAEWLTSGESLESLLSRADAALYKAKAAGRNRALLAERCALSQQEVS
jgi:diguanylate cyclase (GGDEF)-like protein